MNLNRLTNIIEATEEKKVLYVMYNAFRVNDNHSLEYAKILAGNPKNLTIILHHIKEDNPRNNTFFEDGIKGFKKSLQEFSNDIECLEEFQPQYYKFDFIVTDFPYLKEEVALIKSIEEQLKDSQKITKVETNVIVPVRIVSSKEEYSARTIRPKILSKVNEFNDLNTSYENLFEYERKALDLLDDFIVEKLKFYNEHNDPSRELTSKLSVYLKFGFISPLTILNRIRNKFEGVAEEFLEQLIVRRELSYNFIYYNKNYDQFKGITYEWAYQSMNNHIFDERVYLYDRDDYINFRTHDKYFNAAMKEMLYTGYMHGYMRMYWCKKIIEWSRTYEEAYKIAIGLNNYYLLDGNTPNGYSGVAWCFGKHDRAWPSRNIFGKIRYMNENGLKRKFDIDKYVERIEELI